MSAAALQPSFDDLGTPLSEVTFCVVDLETTGSGSEDAITEIGAVKVCGGHVLGEFQTLVRPGGPIAPSVQVLTGITDAMVRDAPPLSAVLPSWSEFSRGTVLVAHNARFDVGFLRRAHEAHGYEWPSPTVVDTLALSRSVLRRDEVPNHKLSTLSMLFRTTTDPCHRALDDARATVDVLHGLLERVGGLGVATLEDLMEVTHRVPAARRGRRVWARNLPEGPGVYWFYLDHVDPPPGRPRSEVLYVGTSVNIRRRVSQYFTASETRARMDEMVRIATGVRARECATTLEAGVRELRLIDAHQPRYNRRSRRQGTVWWVRLTKEGFPRPSVVRHTRSGECHWGPFTNRNEAALAATTLAEAFGLRQCTGPLSTHANGCPLAEMGRCSAPCLHPDVDYQHLVGRANHAMTDDVRELTERLARRISRLAAAERFEDAAEFTARARSVLRATRRRARLASLANCPEIVAARRDAAHWEIHVVRHGRLAGAALCRVGSDPMPTIAATRATAETVVSPDPDIPACTVEEAELVAAWFEQPGVRLVDIDGTWAWPTHCFQPEGCLASRVAALSDDPGDGEGDEAHREDGDMGPDTTPTTRPPRLQPRPTDEGTHGNGADVGDPRRGAQQHRPDDEQRNEDDVGADVLLLHVLDDRHRGQDAEDAAGRPLEGTRNSGETQGRRSTDPRQEVERGQLGGSEHRLDAVADDHQEDRVDDRAEHRGGRQREDERTPHLVVEARVRARGQPPRERQEA